jgi:hypothetical protein
MAFDRKLVPSDLIDAYKKKRAALLVGAGASVGAGLPTWRQLLLELIDTVEKNAPDSAANIGQYRKLAADPSKFLLLATELKETLGNSRFEDFIEQRFRDSKIKPTDLHKKLTQLKLAQFVVTTNYDTLIEQAFRFNRAGFPCEIRRRRHLYVRGCRCHPTLSFAAGILRSESAWRRSESR